MGFDGLLLPAELKRAVIVYRGELTPDYAYLKSFLKRRSESAHALSRIGLRIYIFGQLSDSQVAAWPGGLREGPALAGGLTNRPGSDCPRRHPGRPPCCLFGFILGPGRWEQCHCSGLPNHAGPA
jgi:hypothetical protein